jgi:hypothetical protein
MQHKTLLGAALAAALLGLGAGAQAQQYTTTTTIITTAPPAPRTEVVPAPRAGWVWAPGYYDRRGGEYAWNEGHWMRERSGYEYREPRWVQRGDGSWSLVGNNWERRMAQREDRREFNRNHPDGDRDHDGISNGNDRDIDGDGVPNRRDAFPRDPRRS